MKNNQRTLEQLQQELIALLENQVTDLTVMSKIELGDDVIGEIVRLKTLIKEANLTSAWNDEAHDQRYT